MAAVVGAGGIFTITGKWSARRYYGDLAQFASKVTMERAGYDVIGENIRFRLPSGGWAEVDVFGFNPETSMYLATEAKYVGARGMFSQARATA